MMSKLINYVLSLFKARPVRLAIVRRYCDANGSYVGELYLEQEQGGVGSYRMIGASLDTLPFEIGNGQTYSVGDLRNVLDTANDFLAFMPAKRIRVGAMSPQDNDSVRAMVARLPRRNMTLVVQNRFIEHVLEKGKI